MGAVGAVIGLQAAGSLVGAYGSYKEGLAQQNYYKYLAANSRAEAALTRKQGDQAATFVEGEGAYETGMLRKKETAIAGTQKADLGKNIGGGSVTSSDIARDTSTKATLDRLAVKYNADVAAWKATNDAQTQARNLENQATGEEMAGENAKRAGKIGAISSLLGGSGQVAKTWLDYSKYKTP